MVQNSSIDKMLTIKKVMYDKSYQIYWTNEIEAILWPVVNDAFL